MRRVVLAGFCLAALAMAPAQAQRSVLLEICNETGFRVATAAAYRTSPAESHTLRTWFMIEPGTCLDGGLNGVVGDTVDLHVMSGEWHWPGEGDASWCVPASGGTRVAAAPPCPDGQQERGFRQAPIEPTSRRGPGGIFMGRVGWRIACDGLPAIDAGLCPGAPLDAQGLAQPVRTLEICNPTRRNLDLAILEELADGNYAVVSWPGLAADTCADLYRGFPETGALMVAELDNLHGHQDGQICLPRPTGSLAARSAHCSESEVLAGFKMHTFGARTARFTAFVGQ